MMVIDSHVHYIDEDPLEYIDTLLRRMDENGVDRSVLFGVQGDPMCEDGAVWHAVNAHRDRFIPFACSLRCEFDRDARIFMGHASRPPWLGVGEIYVDRSGEGLGTAYLMRDGSEGYYEHYCPSDRHSNPVYSQVFACCADQRMPVLVHCMDVCTMDELLTLFPRTTFIWGHADFGLFEDEVVALLDRYSNLFCDIGAQFRFCADALLSGEFGSDSSWLPRRFAAWQAAAHRHPTRIMWGSDTFAWADLDADAYRRFREVFSLFCEPFTAETKAAVAGQNVLDLLARRETSA